MLRTVTLHGPLSKFHSTPFEVQADNLRELFSVLFANFPQLRNELRQHTELAILLKNGDHHRFVSEDNIAFPFGALNEIHLGVNEEGSIATAASWFAGQVATAGTFAYAAAYVAAIVVISYVTASIASSLIEKPQTDGRSPDEQRSNIFDEAQNLTGVGHPIPLVYGRFKVGSVVVSSEAESVHQGIGIDDAINFPINSSVSGNLFANDSLGGSTPLATSFTFNGVTTTVPANPATPGSYTGGGVTITLASNGNYTVNSTATLLNGSILEAQVTLTGGNNSVNGYITRLSITTYDDSYVAGAGGGLGPGDGGSGDGGY